MYVYTFYTTLTLYTLSGLFSSLCRVMLHHVHSAWIFLWCGMQNDNYYLWSFDCYNLSTLYSGDNSVHIIHNLNTIPRLYTCVCNVLHRGMYISWISWNKNFCENCTHEVAILGTCTWVLISQKLILRIAVISKFGNYTPLENNPLYYTVLLLLSDSVYTWLVFRKYFLAFLLRFFLEVGLRRPL